MRNDAQSDRFTPYQWPYYDDPLWVLSVNMHRPKYESRRLIRIYLFVGCDGSVHVCRCLYTLFTCTNASHVHALASGYLRDHQPPSESTPESRRSQHDVCVYLRPSPHCTCTCVKRRLTLVSSTPTPTSFTLTMPSDRKEEKRTVDDALWDTVAFLIGAALDVLRTALFILKTPMYVHNIAGSWVNSY